MKLTTMNDLKAEGVFIDGKKVRNEHILYLKGLEELSRMHLFVNSEMLIKHLNRSRSAFETVSVLQKLGYIESNTEPFYPKQWKLTTLGKDILNLVEGK